MSSINRILALGMLLTMPAFVYALEDEIGGDDKQWRYKIFTAEHQAVTNSGSKEIKSIFKIDLETGKVWRYRQGIDEDGKRYEEFFEVPEQ